MYKLAAAFAAGAALAFHAGIASADGIPAHRSVRDAQADACCQARWSGLYFAGSIGYGIASTEPSTRVGQLEDSFGPTLASNIDGRVLSDGVTGTVGIGYDHDIHSGFVAGIFGDYTFGNLERSLDVGFTGSAPNLLGTQVAPSSLTFKAVLGDAWAIGGRLGFSPGCCVLWYATAGYTHTSLELAGLASTDLDGYFIGVGVEQELHSGFSLKLEYRFSDYGSATLTDGPSTQLDFETEVHAIRLGVAYRFGDAGGL